MGIEDIKVLEKEFVQYLTENDYIIETDLLTEEKIETGRYICDGKIFYMDESVEPVGSCFRQSIYDVTDITGQYKIILTADKLRTI